MEYYKILKRQENPGKTTTQMNVIDKASEINQTQKDKHCHSNCMVSQIHREKVEQWFQELGQGGKWGFMV